MQKPKLVIKLQKQVGISYCRSDNGGTPAMCLRTHCWRSSNV